LAAIVHAAHADPRPACVRSFIPITLNTRIMRSTSIGVLAVGILFTACQGDPTQSEPYQQLQDDQKRTEAIVQAKDSSINELFGTINRISGNLRTILAKQGRLGDATGGPEMGKDMEQRVMDDLRGIDSLLEENKTLIARLRKEAKAGEGRMAELARTVEDLERSITEKDAEIGSLKEQLASTNSSLASLIEMYRDKEQLANLQRAELNTAWYAVGSQRELRDNGVLTKEGGVAGLGGVNKLNAAGLNQDYFKQVDITRDMEIPINGKKPRVVTSHPEGSYRMEAGDKLVITDAPKFWSLSRHLVVVVD